VLYSSTWDYIPGPDPLETVGYKLLRNVPVGTVQVDLDWLPTTNHAKLYVTVPTCRGGLIRGVFHNNECQIVAQDIDPGTRPKRVTFHNPTVGDYGLYFANWGPDPIQFIVLATVTP
jgi:hypothetical protein